MAFKILNMANHLFAKDDAWKESEATINYVVGSNGHFEYRKSPLGRFVTKTEAIPQLEEVEEGVFLDIPKIPFKIFDHMAAWHRAIYKKDKTESTIMIFYNQERGYSLFVPEQQNSGANSKYKRHDDPDYVEMLNDNELVMVAHSHPWTSKSAPGPSGTDNNDEKEPILYMIMNNVENIPYVYVSTCPGGKRIKLNFFDIFENPIENEAESPLVRSLLNKHVPEHDIFEMYCDIDSVEVPNEWFSKHRTTSYTSTYVAKKTDKEDDKERDKYWEFEDLDYYSRNFLDGYGQYKFDYSDYTDKYEKKKKSAKDEDVITVVDEGDYMDTYVEFGDVIDYSLDLGELEFARMISTLILEGKGGAINACLKEYEDISDYPTKADLAAAKKAYNF
jgi:hypothetical protein